MLIMNNGQQAYQVVDEPTKTSFMLHPGETAEVPEAKAHQMLTDFPETFASVGKKASPGPDEEQAGQTPSRRKPKAPKVVK